MSLPSLLQPLTRAWQPKRSVAFLTAAPVQQPPNPRQRNQRLPKKRGPVYKIPLEILFAVFELVAPPRTRNGIYALMELTHVCQFWRNALVNKPQVWATIFATVNDCRSFVEMCLKRSGSVPLEVTVDITSRAEYHPTCTCEADGRSRLISDEVDPCERHFVFESLAEKKHSKRIKALEILFDDSHFPDGGELALGGCRFFNSPLPQLIHLKWTDVETPYAVHLFPAPPFPPTLRSLSFEGYWFDQVPSIKNLTSLSFTLYQGCISAETFRAFILNNISLETLSLGDPYFDGSPNGPPVNLLNLKSLTVGRTFYDLSTIFRIPAIQRSSSLLVSFTNINYARFKICASGDGFSFAFHGDLTDILRSWHNFTRDAAPTILHVRLENLASDVDEYMCGDETVTATSLFADAHTLEIGYGFMLYCYKNFLDDLEELGPQLKTIRFEVREESEPFEGSDNYWDWDGELFHAIVDLVVYRSQQGRPFSLVERMVVSEGERVNRQQEFVWRCFYSDRSLDHYVQHE